MELFGPKSFLLVTSKYSSAPVPEEILANLPCKHSIFNCSFTYYFLGPSLPCEFLAQWCPVNLLCGLFCMEGNRDPKVQSTHSIPHLV